MQQPSPSKRPAANELSKYEKELPFNLNDFMDKYLSDEEHPELTRKLVDEFDKEIHERIRVHWKDSARTRRMFINMEAAVVWEDEKSKTMRLTKRNLATLDPKFIPTLQEYVLGRMREEVDPRREQIRALCKANYIDFAEEEAVLESIKSEADEAYSFDELIKHVVKLEEMVKELKAKHAVIEFARARELFMLHLVQWEADNKDTVRKQVRGKNLNNWIPKFRMKTVQILERSTKHLRQMIAEYEAKTGKTFTLIGQVYSDYIKLQMTQVARVKTNFANFTTEKLYFDNPRGGAEGNEIVGRELDPCIAPFIQEEDATPVPDPPEMPVFAEEVGFKFDYY